MMDNPYVVLKARELELDRLASRPHIEPPPAPYDRLLPAFDDNCGFARRTANALIGWLLVRKRGSAASPLAR
jgi:hypothetical protein